MSTRLRVVYTYPGGINGGGAARMYLESWYEKYVGPRPARGSMPEHARLIQMYKKLPASVRGDLWIFREPRGTPRARSRWKQLASHWGIPARIKKLKKTLVQGVASRPPTGRPRIPRPIPLDVESARVAFWNPEQAAATPTQASIPGRVWDRTQNRFINVPDVVQPPTTFTLDWTPITDPITETTQRIQQTAAMLADNQARDTRRLTFEEPLLARQQERTAQLERVARERAEQENDRQW